MYIDGLGEDSFRARIDLLEDAIASIKERRIVDMTDAIQVLKDEINHIKAEQEPVRKQIRELEAQLADGDEQVRRHLAAIAALEGKSPQAKAPRGSNRRRCSRTWRRTPTRSSEKYPSGRASSGACCVRRSRPWRARPPWRRTGPPLRFSLVTSESAPPQ